MNILALKSALQWYVDNGVDEALASAPVDRLSPRPQATEILSTLLTPEASPQTSALTSPVNAAPPPSALAPFGTAEAKLDAIRQAMAANTLEDLSSTIDEFDGLAIRKTATNTVFSDGNPKASIMIVGEAPGADEDRIGKPFVGVSGQLLDRILGCIGLDRHAEDHRNAVYISNILNWRPPGNRNPSPAEVDVCLPFIERHIMLAQPKILVLCGGVAAKALLGREESISKFRKGWHSYKPLTQELGRQNMAIPCIATYHPAYLLRTPSQKAAVWADMLRLDEKRRELGLSG